TLKRSVPFPATCEVKTKGESEWKLLFFCIAAIYMSENQNEFIYINTNKKTLLREREHLAVHRNVQNLFLPHTKFKTKK
ncbi:hypothetical protein Q9306_20500, partial [Bacillus sp. WLY-B-L8]|nr:hypothetical protein [Bacillus sp. WLY-B-L8]